MAKMLNSFVMFVCYDILLYFLGVCSQLYSDYCCNCCFEEEDSKKIEIVNNNSLIIKTLIKTDKTENNKGEQKHKYEVKQLHLLKDFIDNIVAIVRKRNKKKDRMLCERSIFEEEELYKNNRETINNLLKIMKEKEVDDQDLKKLGIEDIDDRAIASILGMAIGDAEGAPYEFAPVIGALYDTKNYSNEKMLSKIETKKPSDSKLPDRYGKFNLKSGQWTDDSSMGLCIADSLIVNEGKIEPVDIMKRFIAWWYCGYNNAFKNDKFHNTSVGLGGNISASFDNFLECKDYNKLEATKAGDKYTSGNGSIMRNAAIPICFSYDLDEALKASDKQSRITHQGNEAADCCKLLTYIVWQILNGNRKDTLKDTLDNILCKDSEIFSKLKEESVKGLAMSEYKVKNPQSGKYENWNWKSQKFGYNENRPGGFQKTYAGSYAMDNMAMSLHILYYTGSFKQSITIASKLCGDADSVASVVGQIAGAYYGLKGIPSRWIKNLIQWDEKTIALRGYMLSQIAKNKKKKEKII